LSDDFRQITNDILGVNSFDLTPSLPLYPESPVIIIDGVFFQSYRTGIARVWESLLKQWANTDFSRHIVVLDRNNTTPRIGGINYRSIPAYDYSNAEADKELLQKICDEEKAELLISTYYTTPVHTPSVFMAYDMIPEICKINLDQPTWREKHYAIRHASAYIAISKNTAKDLSDFFTDIPLESITIALCGVDKRFSPAPKNKIDDFKHKYNIKKPYFLLGNLQGYKNTLLFFKALSQLASRNGFDILATGAGSQLPNEWRQYILGCTFQSLYLTDEELILAYSGAIALVYPSKYEGFGMPIVEAMACGCPVITTRNSSIPEVAGEAALYVGDDDIEGMADALCEVQKPRIRRSLIDAGLVQAQKFSWKKMANIVQEKLLEVASFCKELPSQTQVINYLIFPDWQSSEDDLSLTFAAVLQKLNQNNDCSITLIINITDTTEEEANLLLSTVAMNLLMEEDLEMSENLNFSFIEKFSSSQWEVLLPNVLARIQLDREKLPELDVLEVLEAIESLPVLSAQHPNYLLQPDWNLESDRLAEDLSQALKNLAQQEENEGACVLIDMTGMDSETIALLLSEIVMNLLLEEGIDVNDRFQLSLIHDLRPVQRQALMTQITIISL
jgi:glycosyltransferase involved in cell wall biosynthesis